MAYAKFDLGRNLLVHTEHNSNLVKFVTELAERKEITATTFTVIGTMKQAKLGFYNQEKHEYQEMTLDSPHEIASCLGNISVKDGKPFVNAHAVLADKNGSPEAGHLIEGIVFAAEIHLLKLKGAKLERKYDKVTSLSL